MNRQKIKYLMCLTYNLIGVLSIYSFIKGINNYKTFGHFCLDALPFLFYLISSLIFMNTNMNIDNYFILKMIFRINDIYINNSNDIMKKVKEVLDDKYMGKMDKINRLKQKEDALKNWDGYTSVREKRDDKIKQLTS